MLKTYMRRNKKEIGSRTSGRMVEKPDVQMRYNWHRYFQKVWMLAGMLILSFLMQLLISSAQQSRIQQGIAGEVLRFHVLANSDSREDQAVKLQVRDAVLVWMEAALKETHLQAGLEEGATAEKAIGPQEKKEELWYMENQIRISGSNLRKEETAENGEWKREEMLQFLKSHLSDIEAIANQTLVGQHQSYRATAAIETVYFPERTYGTCTFPAGWYEALRIRLGEAKGHNWWCVLYPRLCFTDCLHAVVEEGEQQELKEVLTEEEYETLLHEPGRWKIGLRILEN